MSIASLTVHPVCLFFVPDKQSRCGAIELAKVQTKHNTD